MRQEQTEILQNLISIYRVLIYEMEDIVMNEASINLNTLTDELRHSTQFIFGDKLRKIILYGSYARGDFTSDSDLDIMVLADFDENEKTILEKQVCKIASDASLDHDVTICMLLNNEDLFRSRLPISPFYRNVVSEGVEIYAAH